MNEVTRPDGTLRDLEGHMHDGKYHSHIGGAVPHDHTEPPRPPKRGGGWIGSGIVLAVLAGLGLWFPWFAAGGGVYSVSQAQGFCQSGIGQVSQAFSADAATNCAMVGLLHAVLAWGVVIGVGLVVLGIVLDVRGQR